MSRIQQVRLFDFYDFGASGFLPMLILGEQTIANEKKQDCRDWNVCTRRNRNQ